MIAGLGRGGSSEWTSSAFESIEVNREGEGEAIPTQYSLSQSYPNPFNANTNIAFELPEESVVSLEVYNLLGQKLATLADGKKAAGRYVVSWDASSYSSGVYFYRLTTENFSATKRMSLIK
ncbi:MAG: T9SS type A sorting domain-containing protein [candidate division Zixibacteria bacterium]|nr:T9SS type A sorting domain-containing protein [candidate division Zixibacteria bacterium]